MANTLQFEYTNHAGIYEQRTVDLSRTHKLWWGHTDHHPEDQWLLTAHDVDRKAMRSFALKDIVATHVGMVLMIGLAAPDIPDEEDPADG